MVEVIGAAAVRYDIGSTIEMKIKRGLLSQFIALLVNRFCWSWRTDDRLLLVVVLVCVICGHRVLWA